MNRLTEAWFEFCGVRCDTKKVRLLHMPRRPAPAERGERIEVPGRSGFLWMPDGARNAIQIAVDCESMDGYTPESVASWLCGTTGFLRFSDEPNRAYKARLIDEYARENTFLRFDRQSFTLVFDCQPWRYIYPEPATITLASSGSVTNSGTVPSDPRIQVTCTGDVTLLIGAYPVEISGGSVIIDSELMEALSADGTLLANDRVTLDEFPKLLPGANAISWSGNVTSVTITPRSRCL